MANVLGNYNPTFFAQEALIQLEKTLGFGARVFRGQESERSGAGHDLGDVINVKRPGNFAAATHVAGTGTTAQDIVAQNVQIALNQHKEVKFKITDRELAYTSEKIIQDHIRPAVYALSDDVDLALYGLASTTGPKQIVSGTINSTYITGPRKVYRNNNGPTDDLHYMVDTGMEAAFLDADMFSKSDTAGPQNVDTALLNGTLGRRFGTEVFVSQNADVTGTTMSSTATASAGTGDRLMTVTSDTAANASGAVAFGNGTTTQTFQAGDTFQVAGDPTVYILTAATTLTAGAGSFTFYPAPRKNWTNTTVVTFTLLNAVEEAANYVNLYFHRNAYALALAPLPMTGDGRGAQIDTVTDPNTGLSIRARMYYDGDTATNFVALDILYGIVTLDPMLGVRAIRATSVAPA